MASDENSKKCIETFKRWCFILVEILFTLFCLIGFVIIVPILFVFYCLLYLYRCLLISYVKHFKKELVGIMDGKSPVVAVDDINDRPLCTIVGIGAFEDATAQEVKDYVAKAAGINEGPLSETSELARSRQYYITWMGFLWWKWEENFSFDDHIKVWDQTEVDINENITDENELMKIVKTIQESPFPNHKSPWDVTIVPNLMLKSVENNHATKTAAAVFRFHHGFADGVSLMKLFMKELFEGSFDGIKKPSYIQKKSISSITLKSLHALRLPYTFLKESLSVIDFNDWHLSSKQLLRSHHKACSKRIPISLIKSIKNTNKVTFTAVLASAISGAISAMMKKQGATVPKTMHAIVPLPWPNHPGGFVNHWSFGYLQLMVGTKDKYKRLLETHHSIECSKTSPVALINYAILTLFSKLPNWIIKHCLLSSCFPTVIFSNFPGPPKQGSVPGVKPIVDVMFTGGPLRGNVGISITVITYGKYIRIVTGFDAAILPKPEMAKDFIDLIENEFDELGKISQV